MSTEGVISLPGNEFNCQTIEVRFRTIPMPFQPRGGGEPTESIRTFIPSPGDFHIEDPYLRKLQADITGVDPSAADEAWLLQTLFRVHVALRRLIPKNRRRLALEVVERTDQYRCMVKSACVTDEGTAGLAKLAGAVHDTTEALLDSAIYRGVPRLPTDDDVAYHEFRWHALVEFEELEDVLAAEFEAKRADMRARITAAYDTPLAGGRARTRSLDEELGEAELGLIEVFDRFRKDHYRRTMQREATIAQRFAPYITRAEALMEPGLTAMRRAESEAEGADRDLSISEYEAVIQANFTAEPADDLLRAVRDAWAGQVGKTREGKARGGKKPGGRRRQFRSSATERPIGEAMSNAIAEAGAAGARLIDRLDAALGNTDIIDKWNCLGWLREDMVDRSPLFMQVLLESEIAHATAKDFGMRRIYRLLRSHMTRAEKRLFMLTYFRLPGLSYHIAADDPVVSSFAFGTDAMALALIAQVIGCGPLRENTGLARELERRWRAYLVMYPHLIGMLRDLDADKKHAERHQACDTEFGALQDQLPDHNASADRMSDVAMDFKKVEQLMETVCTARERRILNHRRNGLGQEEIAKAEGMTQQGVSKAIMTAVHKLQRELNRRRLSQ